MRTSCSVAAILGCRRPVEDDLDVHIALVTVLTLRMCTAGFSASCTASGVAALRFMPAALCW